jgi:type I restriction enzyme S subunit
MGRNGSNDWQTAQLGDVIELFDYQRVPLNSRERQERQGEYPYYGAQGVIDHIDGYIFDGRYILVAEDGENLNSKKLPLALFATGKFWVNNHAHILRGKPGVADDTFLLACLNNADIKPFVTGAAQPKLSQANMRQIEIPLPPLPVQRRIAGILSAYDELMENSQRRIRLLEAMARALYREWFVHFRSPGSDKLPSPRGRRAGDEGSQNEKLPRVASPLGDIPQGWEVKKLKDACHLTMGQSPKSEFYNETGEGQPFHQGVTNFGERFPTDRLFCTVEGRVAEAGDILFSVRAPVGRMNIADKKIIIGRGLSAIRHRDGHQAFLWEQLRNRFTEDDMMGNGAIFAAVTKDDMQGIELICPPAPLVVAATKHFEPIHTELDALTKQIANLRRTRDLLLPRLLSGQVPIAA